MGEGECAGEATRGLFPPGIGMGAESPVWGELAATLGEGAKPNWGTCLAPPLAAKLLGPLAAMVTELWREWAPLAGAAVLPFTGAGETCFSFCAGDAESATTGA